MNEQTEPNDPTVSFTAPSDPTVSFTAASDHGRAATRTATLTATPTTEGHHTGMGSERESGSRLSESNRRPIHYE